MKSYELKEEIILICLMKEYSVIRSFLIGGIKKEDSSSHAH